MDPIQEPGQLIREVQDISAAPPSKSYPPISSIPKTPESRLQAPPTTSSSVLYLAYGSNLCAETLLGFRGIRPISQINVSAPSLDLTFDLPGLPYVEPCFANCGPRKVPKLPDPTNPPKVPPIRPPHFGDGFKDEPQALPEEPKEREEENRDNKDVREQLRPKWSKGLVGVVYEVSLEDYATIVATEGGGASYIDILTPCFPLPPRISVPEKPPIDLPKPFLAHTLFAAAIPDKSQPESSPSADQHGPPPHGDWKQDEPKDPRKRRWYWRWLQRPRRNDPTYAQPSPRYLKLIKDGAREHELPEDYQAYLARLQPYRLTTWKQMIGRILLLALFGPIMLAGVSLSKRVADDKGRAPLWLAGPMAVFFNIVWATYDVVLKPLFGDGERTQKKEEQKQGNSAYSGRRNSRLSFTSRRQRQCGHDEEKLAMPPGTDVD